MKSAVQSVVSSWRNVFGFVIVALMIADGSCRFNRAKAASDEDLQYPCPPGSESCRGLDAGDLAFWTHFCFDIPPSCRTNAEPATPMSLAPAHQSQIPAKSIQPRFRFAVRGR